MRKGGIFESVAKDEFHHGPRPVAGFIVSVYLVAVT